MATTSLYIVISTEYLEKEVNIPGLISVGAFYLVILVIGLVASWIRKRRARKSQGDGAEEMMLAGRDIGLFVGVFTMTGNSSIHTKYVWIGIGSPVPPP